MSMTRPPLRDHPSRGTCRSCGALVVWLDTPAGAVMPVDPEPAAGGNVAVVNGKAAVVVKAGLFEERPPDPERYTSHFATCPDRDTWRKKR